MYLGAMKFKAICSDIDGTLLNAERELSERTIRTIKALPEDVAVILASSRPPQAMRHLQAELDILQWPLICYNGAYVLAFDAEGQPEVLHNTPIPASIARAAVDFAEGTELHVSLYRGYEWYAPRDDQWAQREVRNTKVPVEIVDYGPLLDQWESEDYGPHKIMCMGEPEDIDGVLAHLEQLHNEDLHLYRSRPTYLEIAHKSISKATALTLLADHLGTFQPSEVLSFGDNYNDTELLQLSGKGIAVENAKPEVRAIADEVTAKSIEDGVAQSIASLFAL